MVFFPTMPVSNNTVSVEGAELGRLLFYDPILSADSTFSCGSCHHQEYAFSDNASVSLGIYADSLSRNTMPLFNLAWYPSMFWDGRSPSIENQVFHPVSNPVEMDLNWEIAAERVNRSAFYIKKFRAIFKTDKIDSTHIALVIAQFERTLISANSKYDKVLRGETYLNAQEYRGFVLANDQSKGNCLQCHTTDADALGTTRMFSNNGLSLANSETDYPDIGLSAHTNDSTDAGKFKIPSIRNVGFTAPYMHDGRFETLEEVLDFYSDNLQHSYNRDSKLAPNYSRGFNLNTQEKKDIIAFLHTLSDSSFVSNPKFSNPWE
jgi:cytochrome c peroxidase